MKVAWLIAFGVCLLAGCDLPGIPTFRAVDLSDGGSMADAGRGPEACAPRSRACLGNSVQVCSADGLDFVIEACGLGETCSAGACEPVQDTCEGDQPFALSTTEIAFDLTDDYKAQSRQVRLSNCGTSPILLRDAVVRGPERPDGTPVFHLVSDVAQASIPPASFLEIKLVYQPTAGLSHVTGRLELNLISDELINVAIGLRSKSLCATATPHIDFGVQALGSPYDGRGRIQNCGTEPLQVLGWEGPVTVDVDLDELPADLGAGDEIGFRVSSTPADPGPFGAEVHIALSEGSIEPTTSLHGLTVAADCAPLALPMPQVLANNQARPPRPGDLVRLEFPDTGDGTLFWAELVDQPVASFERLASFGSGWIARPRVVGFYRAEFHAFDPQTGRVSCDTGEVSFDVAPPGGLHVELVWISAGDGIVEDIGLGRSANLDLHVLSSENDEGSWNVDDYDCFPGVVGPCGVGGGSVSISQGGLPEFVHINNVDGLRFEVGVYLSNPFNYPNSLARVRVFRESELVAEQRTYSLQTANDFWLVGRWDEVAAEWTDIDTIFSGFPR